MPATRDWDADQLTFKVLMDAERDLMLDELTYLETHIARLNAIIKDPNANPELILESKAQLDGFVLELDQVKVPEIYTVKERPAYFDMTEILRTGPVN